MKINNIKKSAICLSIMAAVSCTTNFDEINTNPNGFTQKQLGQDLNNIKIHFTPIFLNVFSFDPAWLYQVQQGLQGDVWSGYMATPTPFRGGSNNTTYDLVDGWNGFAWNTAYRNVMYNAHEIELQAKEKYGYFYALSLIMKVEGMHRITDTYGPIVYSKFGSSESAIDYDSQEDVYKKMFSELDYAINFLTNSVNSGIISYKEFNEIDISSYEGNIIKWVKFANSLRLRLALRISNVDANFAKEQAEKAVNNSVGVMTDLDDTLFINSQIYTHPISTISGAWGDIRMSADMESIMGGYNDPRLKSFFVQSEKVSGEYKGVRTGIEIVGKDDRVGFSKIGKIIESKSLAWMTVAETYFLRSEAALRGWNVGGTAQEFYETGIKLSFSQHRASGADAYIADDVKTAKNYVDPVAAANNAVALNNVTVKWNDAETNEVKLQKIITQKWIACFPDGQEAWSEWRRTGYPKLFPVLKNTSGGKINSVLGVRRVNFVQSEKDGNAKGVETGVSKLNGPDTGGTRLWWDTGVNNL